MSTSADSFGTAVEFDDAAGYDWWRNTHPDGYVLAIRASRPPLLHHARCRDVDLNRHPKRFAAKGSRLICSDAKAALRTWLARELPGDGKLIDRCPKCAP
jgi:hypothetical protein